MEISLSTLDITIMAVYLIGIVIYGVMKGKQSSSEEYFLGGRSLTWPVVGISLFAANISSSTLIGLAGAAYLLDMTVYNYEWYAVVVLVFFAIFFLPFYLKSGVYTMPEFLEKRYDVRSRYYFSFITVVGNILIDTAASLYVGMIVLGLIFPSVEPWIVISILAIAAAAYTIPGGLSSVVKTEVIQAIVLIIGSCILTYYAFDKVGGWGAMVEQLNKLHTEGTIDKNATEALSIVRDNSGEWWRQYNEPIVPWWGLLTGVPLLGFYFWANNQFMVQRVLSSKNLNHGRWGALFAGLLKIPVIFIMVIPGTLAFLLYQNSSEISYLTANGPCENLADCIDYTYPTLLFDLLPSGLLGLVVAGLLAAMMSSISATFNSASTLITMDFVNKIRPNMTSKQLVRSGQITTLVLVVLASLWAPQIGKYGNLFGYLQDILGYIAPPIVSVFVLGLFWKRANATGSFVSLMFGICMSLIWVIGIIKGVDYWFFQLHFLLRTTVLFILCLLIHIGVSLATNPPPISKTKDLTWSPRLIAEETEELKAYPWYQNYRILSLILLIITFLVVGMFW
jgi:SSS family solute:Na+ symporter